MTRIQIAGLLWVALAFDAAALDSNLTAPEAPAAYLPPAPWLDPNAPRPPSPPKLRAKSVQSVPPIDTSNLAAVLGAYNTYYATTMPAVNFTGSNATCNPGTVSLAFQEWNITRINFVRAMAGVPGDTVLDSSMNAQEQATALIMSANNMLSHSPSSGATCWTQLGATGASQSNLALGPVDPLPLYMSEPGSGNQVVGHRRWILHTAKDSFGFGQAANPNANALYAFQAAGTFLPAPNGIAWPPRGYVPLPLFPTQFTTTQRWSFGLPNANFGAASVAVTVNSAPLGVTVVSRTDNGYGDNTIVWEMPAGHTVVKGTTYNVAISGVTGASSSTYNYQIMPFDPLDTTTDLALTQTRSPAAAQTGKDVVYTLDVTNSGPGAAANVMLTDTLPATATFIWASPGCTTGPGSVTCAIGPLPGGATKQVKVVVRPFAVGTLVNNATVTGSLTDSNAANNTTSTSTPVTASPAPVAIFRYRLYSDLTKEHHFTTDFNEYTVLGTSPGTSWVQEGTVGRILNNPGSFNGVNAVPYYRLYDTSTRWHHWTTDSNEYYTLAQYSWWNAEGVDGYILPTATAGSMPLYRLTYPALPGLHHWTTDPAEYNALIASFGWGGEPGSGYVIQ